MFIERPGTLLRRIYPQALWRMNHRQRSVFLTFDDGPIPQATPFILDILDKFGIKATFFMVGENAVRYPHLLDEVRRRGHRVGNHSYNHLGGFQSFSRQYIANARKAEDILQTGKLFRPPHGWMSPIQYRRMLADSWRIVMWDVLSRDYNSNVSPDMMFDNVRRYTRPGSIITFHDSLKSIDKLRIILPDIITWLKSQGYTFEVLGDTD